MIVNTLRFSFKDGTSPEDEEAVLAAMRRTASTEPVVFGTVGRYMGDPTEGYTHTYCAAVADLDALERYLHEPVHIDGDWLIIPHLRQLAAFRFSDDSDPDLDAKILALHARKVEMYPEWGRLLDAIPGAKGSFGDGTD
ncbi:Dabb family protein [Streptomyces longispororuber]|uniref:Dabb family protein n=1 Tax=Streptomyces longispororuber TaxID=68230 RepID=UPI00210C6820|nr:Dabb family protein [Streptomyces longispororuber]MCQ4209958.1 Dabb family protein [Streptomyces longispororuber]